MEEAEEEAAARIQAIHRGRLARFSADRRRRSLVRREATARWEREQAVIKIQAACRGTRGREETALYRQQQAAASKIQARIRGDKARKDFNRAAPGGLPLDRADIKKGLHTLGRNPQDLRLCYVGLMAPNAGVSNMDAIVDFPLLQTVDLSGNLISSTKPLSRLPFLHDLDISHNNLTSLLDYELFEGEDFSWKASQDWLHDWRSNIVRSASMLYRVNASYNSIDRLRDMSHHRNIQDLDLSHNSVEVLEGFSALKSLRTLRMNNNKIRRIDELDGLPLVELHLDHNSIEKAENVGSDKLSSLRVLRLSYNNIGNLSNLRYCLSLATLDVRFNKVSAVRQVEYLQECQFLHTVLLEGNPMDRFEAYRARIIFRLQGLMVLDRNKISPEEKVKAVNLMGDEDSELPHRKAVFEKHLPGVEFTNTLPPFCEPEGPPEPEPESNQAAVAMESNSGSSSVPIGGDGGSSHERGSQPASGLTSTAAFASGEAPAKPAALSRGATSSAEQIVTTAAFASSPPSRVNVLQ